MGKIRCALLLGAIALLGCVSTWRPAVAAIDGDTWTPMGPAPIQGYFGNSTGRATALAVNPHDPDDIWLGTACGGVWHSTDGGLNWAPQTDDQDSLAIGSLALADCSPSGCGLVFAGTGEDGIRRDTYFGSGLLVGTLDVPPDYSWRRIDESSSGFSFLWGSMIRIALDPTTTGSTRRLYMALSGGVTTSATEATVTAPSPSGGYGIYEAVYDTTTETASWVKHDVPLVAAGAKPTDLVIDPHDSNVLYAGFLGEGVFRGERQLDGTVTWCPLTEGIPASGCPPTAGLPGAVTDPFDYVRVVVFPGVSSGRILYATLGHCADRLMQNCKPSVYKSNDGGGSWHLETAGTPTHLDDPDLIYQDALRGYSRYTHALAVHPASEDTIFVGGLRLWRKTGTSSFYSCRDLRRRLLGRCDVDPYIHLDHRAVLFHPDPAHHHRMYNTSDGGFAYSTDGGDTWTPANETLQITGFHSIAASPLVDVVIGGTQDNGTVLWDGSDAWHHVMGGDGGFTVIDGLGLVTLYAGGNFGVPFRSVDWGDRWQDYSSGISEDDPRLFYAPIVQDPSPSYPLYWGSNRLFRRRRTETSWSAVSPVLCQRDEFGTRNEIVTASSTAAHLPPGNSVDVISAIAVAPLEPLRIYVGCYGGEVWTTTAAGPCDTMDCWQPASTGLPVAHHMPVTRIAVHPLLPNVAYVTYSGFADQDHVWKTGDTGASWSPIVTGLPSFVPVNTISVEQYGPYALWLGLDGSWTGSSVYKSTDGGATWVPFGNGLPNVPVYEIALDDVRGRAYAGTHGRGAFVLGDPYIRALLSPIGDYVFDLPLLGGRFLPSGSGGGGLDRNSACTVELLQSTGDVCAQGSVDAMGGTIEAVPRGTLATSKQGFWNENPVVWACYDGECLGATPVAECYDDEDNDGNDDPLSTVRVTCDGDLTSDTMPDCPERENPPSSRLKMLVTGIAARDAGEAFFEVTASVVGCQDTLSLCTVSVPRDPGATAPDLLLDAQDAIAASPTCVAQGVTAGIEGERGGPEEDEYAGEPRLRIDAPNVSGRQLNTALHVQPGGGTEACFSVGRLGVPLLSQVQVVTLEFETIAAGAAGGTVTVRERSTRGDCAITVPTLPGQSATDVAQAVLQAFHQPGVPGPHPECPAWRNLRDVRGAGDTLTFVFASDLEICADDAGVGFSVRPAGLANVHPASHAGPDQSLPCSGPNGTAFLLDGSGSTDPDSTPDTNDDIQLFEWFEDFGLPTETFLGSGETLPVMLDLGIHSITLRVTDDEGLTARDEAVLSVVPDAAASVAPDILWPPNHRMVDVAASVSVTDCGGNPSVVLASVTSDEADDAAGAGDGLTVGDIQGAEPGTADFQFQLRAERMAGADGRTYFVTYTVSDPSGVEADSLALVQVPHDQNGVTEPVQIVLSQNAAGTIVEWTAVPEALSYNVIRGQLDGLTVTTDAYYLGDVVCIEADSLDTSTAGWEDTSVPAPDQVFFYVVDYDDGSRCGYGTESAGRPRIPVSGDCP